MAIAFHIILRLPCLLLPMLGSVGLFRFCASLFFAPWFFYSAFVCVLTFFFSFFLSFLLPLLSSYAFFFRFLLLFLFFFVSLFIFFLSCFIAFFLRFMLCSMLSFPSLFRHRFACFGFGYVFFCVGLYYKRGLWCCFVPWWCWLNVFSISSSASFWRGNQVDGLTRRHTYSAERCEPQRIHRASLLKCLRTLIAFAEMSGKRLAFAEVRERFPNWKSLGHWRIVDMSFAWPKVDREWP